MEALSVTVTPAPEAAPAKSRRPARRTVTEKVAVPTPAPIVAQAIALILLLALVAGAIYLLTNGDSAGLQVAGAVVLVLAAFVLVVWAAAVLGTGLGPKQLLEVLKTVVDAIRSSGEKEDG